MTRMPEIQEVLNLLEKMALDIKDLTKKVEKLQHSKSHYTPYTPWYISPIIDEDPNGLR